MRRLLLLSNSRNPGMGYLEHARPHLREFLGSAVRTVAFVPYAGVTIAWDTYAESAGAPFKDLGYEVRSVHKGDAARTLATANAIAVGGGNTFYLLRELRQRKLLDVIRGRVGEGVPYMGWSAGSNVASPTIRTTNDMPIVEPGGFDALNLVPFQLNPHYTDERIPNHGGESRADRIGEFVRSNPDVDVVGLREGSILRIEGNDVRLLGPHPVKLFRSGSEPREVDPTESLSFLIGS